MAKEKQDKSSIKNSGEKSNDDKAISFQRAVFIVCNLKRLIKKPEKAGGSSAGSSSGKNHKCEPSLAGSKLAHTGNLYDCTDSQDLEDGPFGGLMRPTGTGGSRSDYCRSELLDGFGRQAAICDPNRAVSGIAGDLAAHGSTSARLQRRRCLREQQIRRRRQMRRALTLPNLFFSIPTLQLAASNNSHEGQELLVPIGDFGAFHNADRNQSIAPCICIGPAHNHFETTVHMSRHLNWSAAPGAAQPETNDALQCSKKQTTEPMRAFGAELESPNLNETIERLQFRRLGVSRAVACPIWARIMDELDEKLLLSCSQVANSLQSQSEQIQQRASGDEATGNNNEHHETMADSERWPDVDNQRDGIDRPRDVLESTSGQCYSKLIKSPEKNSYTMAPKRINQEQTKDDSLAGRSARAFGRHRRRHRRRRRRPRSNCGGGVAAGRISSRGGSGGKFKCSPDYSSQDCAAADAANNQAFDNDDDSDIDDADADPDDGLESFSFDDDDHASDKQNGSDQDQYDSDCENDVSSDNDNNADNEDLNEDRVQIGPNQSTGLAGSDDNFSYYDLELKRMSRAAHGERLPHDCNYSSAIVGRANRCAYDLDDTKDRIRNHQDEYDQFAHDVPEVYENQDANNRRDSSTSNTLIQITRCDPYDNDDLTSKSHHLKNCKQSTMSKSNKTLKRFRSALNLFEPISNAGSTTTSNNNGDSSYLHTSPTKMLQAQTNRSPISIASSNKSTWNARTAPSDKIDQDRTLISVPKINVGKGNKHDNKKQQEMIGQKLSGKNSGVLAEVESNETTRAGIYGPNQSDSMLGLPDTSESRMLQIARQRRPSSCNQTTINVNQQALFSAVERNQLGRARSILSSKSANVNSFSGDKLSCLDIAVLLRNNRMVRLLQQYGAKESSPFLSAEQRAHQLRSLYLEARQLVEDLSRSLSGRQSPLSNGNFAGDASGSDLGAFVPTSQSQLSNALIEEKHRQLHYWRRRLEFFMRMRYEFERLKPPFEPELVVLEVKGERDLSVKIVHSSRASKLIASSKNTQSTLRPGLVANCELPTRPTGLSAEPWPSMSKCLCLNAPNAWSHPSRFTSTLISPLVMTIGHHQQPGQQQARSQAEKNAANNQFSAQDNATNCDSQTGSGEASAPMRNCVLNPLGYQNKINTGDECDSDEAHKRKVAAFDQILSKQLMVMHQQQMRADKQKTLINTAQEPQSLNESTFVSGDGRPFGEDQFQRPARSDSGERQQFRTHPNIGASDRSLSCWEQQQQQNHQHYDANYPLGHQSIAYRVLSGNQALRNNYPEPNSHHNSGINYSRYGFAAPTVAKFDSFEFEDAQDCNELANDEQRQAYLQSGCSKLNNNNSYRCANDTTLLRDDYNILYDDEANLLSRDGITTKYLVEWSEDANFSNKVVNSMIVYKTTTQRVIESRIGSLHCGRAYYVRVAAGNHKGYSAWQYSTPSHLTPSSWRQVEGSRRRRLDELVLSKFMQLILLNKHILNTNNNHYSSGLLNPFRIDVTSSGSNQKKSQINENKRSNKKRPSRATSRNDATIKAGIDCGADYHKSLIGMILQETSKSSPSNQNTELCKQQLLASLYSPQNVNKSDINKELLGELVSSAQISNNAQESNQEDSYQPSSASSSVRKNLKSFFQSNSFKFHKLSNQNKRGLYLSTIIYHTEDHHHATNPSSTSKGRKNLNQQQAHQLLEVPGSGRKSNGRASGPNTGGRVIVTNDERLPVIEILNEVVSPAALLNDFYWLLKISGTHWIDIKRLRQQLQKAHSSSILHLRIKLLIAIEQMQLALNLEDIGRLFYKPIQSHDGSIVICTCRRATNTKLVSSLSIKWVSQNKIIPGHLRKISDSLTNQEQQNRSQEKYYYGSGSSQQLTVQEGYRNNSNSSISPTNSDASGINNNTLNSNVISGNCCYCSDYCAKMGREARGSTGTGWMRAEKGANSSPSSSHNSLTSHSAAVKGSGTNYNSCESSNSSLASGNSMQDEHSYDSQNSVINRIRCANCGKSTLPATPSIKTSQDRAGGFNSNSLGLSTSGQTSNYPRLSTSSAVYPSSQNRSGSMYLAASSASTHFTSRHSQPISLGVGAAAQRSSHYLMLASLTIYDLLLYTLDEMINFDRNSNNKMKGGLYLGFLQLSATIESMRLLVSRSGPNMLPCARIRDNSHVSKEEWQLLTDLLSANHLTKHQNQKLAGDHRGPGSISKSNSPTSNRRRHFEPIPAAYRAKSVSPSRYVSDTNPSAPTSTIQSSATPLFDAYSFKRSSSSDRQFSAHLNSRANCVVTLSASNENISPNRSTSITILNEDNQSTTIAETTRNNNKNHHKHQHSSTSSLNKTTDKIISDNNHRDSRRSNRSGSFGSSETPMVRAGPISITTRSPLTSNSASNCSIEQPVSQSAGQFKLNTGCQCRLQQTGSKRTGFDALSIDINSPAATFVRQIGSAARKLIDKLINSIPRQYDVRLDDMISMLATLNDPELNRVYHLELIEIAPDISFVILIPSVENICPVTTQENSNLLSTNNEFMFLPMQFFETLHIGTYEPELLLKYSRLSVTLETELTLALHDHRQAFSSSELKNTKSRVSNLQEMVSISEDFWRQMRWLTEVVSFGRDKSLNGPQSGIRIGYIWDYFDSPEAFRRYRLNQLAVRRNDKEVAMMQSNSFNIHEKHDVNAEIINRDASTRKNETIDTNADNQQDVGEFFGAKVDLIVSDNTKPIDVTLTRRFSDDDGGKLLQIESQSLDCPPEAYHISLISDAETRQLLVDDPFDTSCAQSILDMQKTNYNNSKTGRFSKRKTNPFLTSFDD